MQTEPEKQKRCSKCKETKPVGAFHKRKDSKDGYRNECKACKNALDAAHYEANRESRRAYSAAYYEANKESYRVWHAAHYKANRDKIRARSAAHYEANRESSLAKSSAWQKANPEKCRARNQRRRARKANAEGSFTADEWKFTLKVLDYRCIYCNIHKDDTPEKWLEADHLTPLSRGGTNYIDNIAPACKSCNCSKGSKTFDEFIDYLVETGKL